MHEIISNLSFPFPANKLVTFDVPIRMRIKRKEANKPSKKVNELKTNENGVPIKTLRIHNTVTTALPSTMGSAVAAAI